MKKVPKRFKTVPKWTKLHKIYKKKIKILTLERNYDVKNGIFWLNVDVVLDFIFKKLILTLRFGQIFTDKGQKM